MKEVKRTVFQAALSESDMKKLREIAAIKEVKMSEAFRSWIRTSHKQLTR